MPDHAKKEDIKKNINKIESMTSTLLETVKQSQTENVNLQKGDLSLFVKKWLDSSGFSKEKVQFKERPETLLIYDSGKMDIILKNIVENAVKYSQGNVFIYFESENCLCVKDQGIGISQEDLNKIFEPFYRVDMSRTRQTGGYGLGLTLTKRLVEAQGATIKIESQINSFCDVNIDSNSQ